MKLTIVASMSLSGLVTANNISPRQASSYLGARGPWLPGSFGLDPTPEEQQFFIAAGERPNATGSVNFDFAPGNLSGSTVSWNWKVKISEVDVPKRDGRKAVNTQWELQWPGAGGIQSYLARAGMNDSESGGICLKVAEYILPSNVTRRYSESDNGACTAVLGSECAAFIGAASGDCDSPIPPIPTGRCMDTLAVSKTGSHADPGFLIDSTFNRSLSSGDTFWYHTSPSVAAVNTSYSLTEAETRLSILIISEAPIEGSVSTVPTMLCQVVNPSAANAASTSTAGASMRLLVLVFICGVVLL